MGSETPGFRHTPRARVSTCTPVKTRRPTSSPGSSPTGSGTKIFEAGPETLVWLPRSVPHTFANRGDEEAWVVGVTSPAGIEAMFEEQAAYFAGLTGPPDPTYLAELGARFGVTALGPSLDV